MLKATNQEALQCVLDTTRVYNMNVIALEEERWLGNGNIRKEDTINQILEKKSPNIFNLFVFEYLEQSILMLN